MARKLIFAFVVHQMKSIARISYCSCQTILTMIVCMNVVGNCRKKIQGKTSNSVFPTRFDIFCNSDNLLQPTTNSKNKTTYDMLRQPKTCYDNLRHLMTAKNVKTCRKNRIWGFSLENFTTVSDNNRLSHRLLPQDEVLRCKQTTKRNAGEMKAPY